MSRSDALADISAIFTAGGCYTGPTLGWVHRAQAHGDLEIVAKALRQFSDDGADPWVLARDFRRWVDFSGAVEWVAFGRLDAEQQLALLEAMGA